MHFANIFGLLSLTVAASATRVAYDTGYDQAGRSMAVVSCSDGANGLMSRFPTQGDLPVFPRIGGAAAIAGWNSPNCGTCWSLTWNSKTIYVLAIDHSGDGFTISQEALDDLTNGQAVALGAIDAATAQVDKSICGL